MAGARISVTLLELALTVATGATSAFGGLSPAEAAERSYSAMSVSVEVPVVGRIAYIAELGGALHRWHGDPAYGVGLAPLGARVRLGDWDVTALGGVWRYDQEVPVAGGHRWPLTGQVELGWTHGRVRVATVFYHLSNAGRGRVNPGLNAWALRVGVRP